MAERQRWRTARDSSTIPTSILTNVAHRATSLWSRRSSRPPSDGGGKHRVLETSEDSTHLDGMVSSPLSASQSRSNTPAPDESRTGPYAHTTDPFSDPPPGSTSSLFINAQPITLDIGVITEHEESESATASSHPTKKSKTINVPAPLDLPRPRSPPPLTASPQANRPPEPFPRPKSSMSVNEEEDDTPVRWWTEWLCGCSEGPDRGGEAQVRPVTSVCPRSAFLISRYRLAGRTLSNNVVTAPFLICSNDGLWQSWYDRTVCVPYSIGQSSRMFRFYTLVDSFTPLAGE